MFFSITEPEEIQVFRELSGEELQTYGLGDVEEIRLRMSTKELASLSDHPKRLLLQISSGSGYSQFGGLPIPVETDWPISKELADSRAAMPWPTSPVVVKRPPAPKPPKVAPSVKNAAPIVPAVSPAPIVQASAPAQVVTPLPVAQAAPPVVPEQARSGSTPLTGRPMTPKKGKKKKVTSPAPLSPKPAPSPAVKQAFAQKIQGLFKE